MKTNVGLADRIIRLLVAVALYIVYFSGEEKGGWWVLLPVTGSILLASSIVGVSLLYTVFGINTKGGSRPAQTRNSDCF